MSTMSYSFEDGQVYEFVDRRTHNNALTELDAAWSLSKHWHKQADQLSAELDAARTSLAEIQASAPIAVIGAMQLEIDQLQADKAALETLLAEWQEDYALEHKRARKWRRKYKALVELAECAE